MSIREMARDPAGCRVPSALHRSGHRTAAMRPLGSDGDTSPAPPASGRNEEGMTILDRLPATRPFLDRHHAGRQLAEQLRVYANRPDAVVLALPRGGVPVGYEVAAALGLPLDVFLVRKLGVPGYEELAMGAIASGGVRVLNDDVIREIGIPDRAIDAATAAEQQELERREHRYRGSRPAPNVRGHTVILVDDGLATGYTMRAAVEALRQLGAARIVAAVPVAAPQVCDAFR